MKGKSFYTSGKLNVELLVNFTVWHYCLKKILK